MLNNAKAFGQTASKLARPQNVIYSGGVSVITAYITTKSLLTSAVCYLAILFLYSLAAGFNNISDLETDRLNGRLDNPLIKNRLKSFELGIFFTGNLALLLLVQIFLYQPASIITCSFFLLLLFSYSYKYINLKSKGYLATITLCVCYGGLPFVLGAVQGSFNRSMAYFFILQSVLMFPIILAKDYKDIKGDHLTNKKTPIVMYGYKTVLIVAIAVAVMGSTLFLLVTNAVSIYVQLATVMGYLVLVVGLHYKKAKIQQSYRMTLTLVMFVMLIQVLQ